MKAKRTDKATVVVLIVGVAVYLANFVHLLWSPLYFVFGSHAYNWIFTAGWLVYLAVVLALGVIWRKKSWLIGVGVMGVLGAITHLNHSVGLLPLFLFLSPYSASHRLWLVYPVAILPWILLAVVSCLNRRAAARVAPTIHREN